MPLNEMNPKESTIAIVVTYNRKELLVRCLEALLTQQQQVNDILIIDNDSRDGTQAYLEENGYLNNKMVSYINIGKNLGGAGGFSYGLAYAIKNNFTWMWLMDDDAIPDQSCFATLWAHRRTDTALCPLCVDEQCLDKLAFSAPGASNSPDNSWIIKTITDNTVDDVYNGWGALFNGVLLHNDIVRKIGLVKSEMFIWGDEEEYRLRIQSHQYFIATIASAILKHPKERCDWINITKTRKVIKFSYNWKIYSYYRNRGYISRKYSRKKGIFTFLMYTYYFIFIEKSFSKYKFFIVAWCDGYFNLYKRTLPF